MNRTERFYLIDKMLSERKVVTRQELVHELGISWVTLKRDLAYLKDRFNALIIPCIEIMPPLHLLPLGT
jgi:DeoR/GlpR family transcriptional regulator of sugar metabolism